MNLLILFNIFSPVLIVLLLFLFFSLSKKMEYDYFQGTAFECGFTSYFFSRFSFSIHYFSVALIFLFLDLELCFLMPLFSEELSSLKESMILWTIILILLFGLLKEWKAGDLEWKF